MLVEKSELWQHIADTQVIAIVGLSKNCGKTVVLNHLLRLAAEKNVRIGLTSIGRDGEAYDEVYHLPKPAVNIASGTLVATAQASLARAKVQYKIIAKTGISSAMGEIILLESTSEGTIEIAGASSSTGQQQLIKSLTALGCDKIFLDGALGRKQHAASNISDAIILASGAVLSSTTMEEVLLKTRNFVDLFCLPAIKANEYPNLYPLIADFFSLQLDKSKRSFAIFNAQQQLTYQEESNSWQLNLYLDKYLAQSTICYLQEIAALVVSGFVAEQLFSKIIKLAMRVSEFVLLIKDSTQLFIEKKQLSIYASYGGKIMVFSPINLRAICLNPYSPYTNSSYPPNEFLNAAKIKFPEYYVCDVMLD